jgi:hypothetical protein
MFDHLDPLHKMAGVNVTIGDQLGYRDGGAFATSPWVRSLVRQYRLPFVRVFFYPGGTRRDRLHRGMLTYILQSGATPFINLPYGETLANLQHYIDLIVEYCGNNEVLIEFGNEPQGAHIPLVEWITRWNALVPALKAWGRPAYKWGGPTLNYEARAWIYHFVAHANPLPDFISWHWYPYTYGTLASFDWRTALTTVFDDLESKVYAASSALRDAGHPEIPQIISEYNLIATPGNPRFHTPQHDQMPQIYQWTQRVLDRLASLAPHGLQGAAIWALCTFHEWELVDTPTLTLTPQGQAFFAKLSSLAQL